MEGIEETMEVIVDTNKVLVAIRIGDKIYSCHQGRKICSCLFNRSAMA